MEWMHCCTTARGPTHKFNGFISGLRVSLYTRPIRNRFQRQWSTNQNVNSIHHAASITAIAVITNACASVFGMLTTVCLSLPLRSSSGHLRSATRSDRPPFHSIVFSQPNSIYHSLDLSHFVSLYRIFWNSYVNRSTHWLYNRWINRVDAAIPNWSKRLRRRKQYKIIDNCK